MVLHFAYGSNMSRTLMRRLCPAARPVGPARLDGWRFMIMRQGYASIVPRAGGVVHGVLWRLAAGELAALNRYENLSGGLYALRLLPVRDAHGCRLALVYVGRSRTPGRPRPGYQDRIVVPAARDWALPAWYIAELERFARNGAGAAPTAGPQHE